MRGRRVIVESYFPDGTRSFVLLGVISDELTPEGVSAAMGVEPDRSWRKGDLRGNLASSARPRKNNGWFLEPGLGELEAFELQLSTSLDRLSPFARSLKGLALDNTVMLTCAIYL